MRLIDQTRTHLMSAARRWAARLPAPIGPRVRPASLGLHLSPVLPGERPSAEPMPTPSWPILRAAIVELVADQGPLPVDVLSVGRALDSGALGLVRLAHRLDCPVTLWTDGTGFDAAGAEALLGVGCASVVVTVASLDEEVQREVIGNGVAEATDAIVSLVAARDARAAATGVVLGLPWVRRVEEEARGLVGWAQQAGVDEVLLLPPMQGGQVGPMAEWPQILTRLGVHGLSGADVRYLTALAGEDGHLPGVSRAAADPLARARPCPVVGTRAALDASGVLFSCPFHPPMGSVGDSICEVWKADTEHRSAVRACNRRCRHPALALGPGLHRTPSRSI